MGEWGTRWQRARQHGFGQAWRAGLAYRLHDSAVLHGQPPRHDIGRLLSWGQRPVLLPTAQPGITPGWGVHVVEEAREFDVPIPRVWLDDGIDAQLVSPPPVPRARTAGVRRLMVSGGTIQAGQSLVVTEDAALVPELLDRVPVGPGQWAPGRRACVSPWRHRDDDVAVDEVTEQRLFAYTATLWRARDVVIHVPRAIALVESVDHHFGHGMLDLLHRLRAVADLPESWPIVVSEQMPRTVVSWIGAVCPERDILRLRMGRVLRADHLVVPLQNARLWLNPERLAETDPVPATIDPSAMAWLQGVGALHASQRHRRLWIRRDRSPHASVVDEPMLLERARVHGFESVYLEDLSFDETRSLLSETSHVIAPMASAVANLTMARSGLRVLQLTDELTWLDRYGSLTWLEALGHDSALLVGTHQGSNYTVSPAALDRALRWLLG